MRFKVGDKFICYINSPPIVSIVQKVFKKNGQNWVEFNDDVITEDELLGDSCHYEFIRGED